jgi:hypothetical protein
VPSTVEKKCSRCGEPFSCQQEAGCWCATMRLDPTTLAELGARFSDCLCEAGQVHSRTQLSGDAVYRHESSKVLNNVMRDYQPIWRIRSRMSPL